MSDKSTTKMNTKFVGHHISSGGFIFYKDQKTRKLYILLIKNKKNEYWIPKGHIEKGEDQISAAFREIEEEVGLKKNQIKYIGLCCLYKFSFTDDDGSPNTKEIYMNVFEAYEKYRLNKEEGATDLTDVGWFECSKALGIIMSFSKSELIKAKKMFENYLQNNIYFVNAHTSKVKN